METSIRGKTIDMGRQRYTKEFKAEAVQLAREAKQSGRSVTSIARDLGVKENNLHRWTQLAAKEKLAVEAGGLNADERKRLKELERENRVLRMERDILKKATAFFAKENA